MKYMFHIKYYINDIICTERYIDTDLINMKYDYQDLLKVHKDMGYEITHVKDINDLIPTVCIYTYCLYKGIKGDTSITVSVFHG